jgi:hypothetical protein
VHGISEHLWARPFRTEVASFAIIVASVARVSHALLGLRVIIPWAVVAAYLRF